MFDLFFVILSNCWCIGLCKGLEVKQVYRACRYLAKSMTGIKILSGEHLYRTSLMCLRCRWLMISYLITHFKLVLVSGLLTF